MFLVSMKNKKSHLDKYFISIDLILKKSLFGNDCEKFKLLRQCKRKTNYQIRLAKKHVPGLKKEKPVTS